MNGIARRLENLEASIPPNGICTACFTAEGDGFSDCTRPELRGDRHRCGKYVAVKELSDPELEQIVTARAACYGLDMETYLNRVAQQEDCQSKFWGYPGDSSMMSFPTL